MHKVRGGLRSNIVQICLVGLLIVWLIFEFVMQIKLHMRLQFSWQEVLFVQLFLCLSCTPPLTQSTSALLSIPTSSFGTSSNRSSFKFTSPLSSTTSP
jgi:hypothetical protein